MRTYGFHPEASLELSEAIDHYHEIDSKLAESFISEIEYSLLIARRNPKRWRIVEGDFAGPWCIVFRMEFIPPSRVKRCRSGQ